MLKPRGVVFLFQSTAGERGYLDKDMVSGIFRLLLVYIRVTGNWI